MFKIFFDNLWLDEDSLIVLGITINWTELAICVFNFVIGIEKEN
ncbi:MAG: hypothetical protein V1901_04305 [Patescibacteria group bacterium]